MNSGDRKPLPNSPTTGRIVGHSNNRLGAVYSSLYSFWSARHAAITAGQQPAARRDSYSVILFDDAVVNGITNDFARSPDQLLEAVLQYRAGGATNFTAAIKQAQTLMERHWSTERYAQVPIRGLRFLFVQNSRCYLPVRRYMLRR
jgi:hypothetical protein